VANNQNAEVYNLLVIHHDLVEEEDILCVEVYTAHAQEVGGNNLKLREVYSHNPYAQRVAGNQIEGVCNLLEDHDDGLVEEEDILCEEVCSALVHDVEVEEDILYEEVCSWV